MSEQRRQHRVRRRASDERVASVVAQGHVRRARAALRDERDGPYAGLVPDEGAGEDPGLGGEDVDAAVGEPDDDPRRVDGDRGRDRGVVHLRVRRAGCVRVVGRGGLEGCTMHAQ